MEIGRATGFWVRFGIRVVVAEVSGFSFGSSLFVEFADGQPVFLGREFVFRDGRRSKSQVSKPVQLGVDRVTRRTYPTISRSTSRNFFMASWPPLCCR